MLDSMGSPNYKPNPKLARALVSKALPSCSFNIILIEYKANSAYMYSS